MHTSPAAGLACAVLMLASLLAPPHVCAAAGGVAANRQAFLAAAASLAAEPSAFDAQRRQLAGYVLAPYLDYARLRRNLSTLDPGAARRFLDSEATTQLGNQFRREYLAELARRGDWPGFLAFDTADADSTTILRCQRVRALLATNKQAAARGEFLNLWPTGQSLPDDCDEPIATAQDRGWLTDALVWKRLRLAVDEANPGLASSLARRLPEIQQVDGERLARAVADPEGSLRAAETWPDQPLHREAVAQALQRRARADIDDAIDHWQFLAPRFDFSPGERAAILHDLALYAAVAYQPGAEDWFELVPVEARSEQLVDWQLRAALGTENWPSLLKVTDGLPESMAASSRARYWRARALARVQRDAEARGVYAALATEATYYGFLAADQLKAPYAICPKEIQPDPARAEALRGQGDAARALELYAVGWRTEAVRAWNFARGNLGEADRLQMILLASEQGWHDRAVFALNTGDDLRYYTLRFPLAERATVHKEATANGLDPSWAFALIRSESAWQPDVRSSANALGLMQLLPATGQQMARQLGMNWRGSSMLLDPATNIRLGTRYLAQQADRFEGSPWLATAAYNAGPAPVQRWLADRGALPADVFIETIPYRETREYVARVLAFSVLYDWLLNGKVVPLSSRLAASNQRDSAAPPTVARRRSVVCPVAAG